jgi:hypothetical protein
VSCEACDMHLHRFNRGVRVLGSACVLLPPPQLLEIPDKGRSPVTREVTLQWLSHCCLLRASACSPLRLSLALFLDRLERAHACVNTFRCLLSGACCCAPDLLTRRAFCLCRQHWHAFCLTLRGEAGVAHDAGHSQEITGDSCD